MSKRPYFGRLRKAAAIVAGVPANRVDLSTIARSADENINGRECGTCACAIGWLGMHPGFRALGLKTEVDSDGEFLSLAYRNVKVRNESDYDIVAAEVFNLPQMEARELFAYASHSCPILGTWEQGIHSLDPRLVFARRIVALFDKYGEKVSLDYRAYAQQGAA